MPSNKAPFTQSTIIDDTAKASSPTKAVTTTAATSLVQIIQPLPEIVIPDIVVPEVYPFGFDPVLDYSHNTNTASIVHTDSDKVATLTSYGNDVSANLFGKIIRFSGKKYIEFQILQGGDTTYGITIQLMQSSEIHQDGDPARVYEVGSNSPRIQGFGFEAKGLFNGHFRAVYNNGVMLGGGNSSFQLKNINDVCGLAIDFEALTVDVYINNALIMHSQDYGYGSAFGSLRPSVILPAWQMWSIKLNETLSDLVYSPPSGYTPWGDEDFIGLL